MSESRKVARWLWLLLGAFCLRVIGQMLVVFADVKFLPPNEEWYSGLLPYPLLLPAQWIIIALFVKICADFSQGKGYFIATRPFFYRGLRWFAYLYLGGMVLRYPIRMILVPEARWFGQTIPIFFHWVLASYLIVFSHYHLRASRAG